MRSCAILPKICLPCSLVSKFLHCRKTLPTSILHSVWTQESRKHFMIHIPKVLDILPIRPDPWDSSTLGSPSYAHIYWVWTKCSMILSPDYLLSCPDECRGWGWALYNTSMALPPSLAPPHLARNTTVLSHSIPFSCVLLRNIQHKLAVFWGSPLPALVILMIQIQKVTKKENTGN